MDLTSISSSLMDTTMQSATFAKKSQELNDFKTTLDGAVSTSAEDDESLKEMCLSFEKYFLKEMFKSMKSTVNYDNFMTYGGQSEEVFSDMLEEQNIEAAVNSGGIGLAKKLYQQLKSPGSATGSAMINDANEAADTSNNITEISGDSKVGND